MLYKVGNYDIVLINEDRSGNPYLYMHSQINTW